MPLLTVDVEQAVISLEHGLKNHLPHILQVHSPNEAAEKAIIEAIRRLTATAKHRRHGLECLSHVITSLSPTTVRDNAFLWIELCTVKYTDDVLRELKLRVLGEIVKVCHKEPDFNRRFVTNYLSKVFDTCLTTVRVNPYECKAALTTLTELMQTYPSWFGVYKEKIEAFIVIFLDNSDKDLVRAAAKAFHYLQQVGGAGTNGDNHKTNFTRSLHKLCNTFHSVYAKIVENHSFSANSSEEGFMFPDPQDDFELNSRRIENVLEFLQTMIRTGFPVAKEVKPAVLLNVLTTALSFHKCLANSDEHSLEDYRCSFVLLRLQSTALKCLKLLLIWLKTNLLPFSYQISRMIVESVERTRSCLCYKFDSLFTESTFAALTEWLSICKSSLHPQFQARLLDVLIEQIAPAKAEITLTISESLSGKSEKARRKAMTNRIIEGGRETTTNPNDTLTAPSKMTLTALKCLLHSTNLSVKPSLLKRLYRSVFDTLLELQRFVAHRQGLAELYEILVGFYEQNVSVLPPLHTALTILSRGANGNDRFVAATCAEGLRFLEGMCQPVCPSLYLRREEELEEPTESGDVELNENGQDSDQEVAEYQVRYTESDRSTVEDGFSENGALHHDLSVQDVTEEAPDAPTHDPPIVTAPSEDGNEILEDLEDPKPVEDEPQVASKDENPAAKTDDLDNPEIQVLQATEDLLEQKSQNTADLDQPAIQEETVELQEEKIEDPATEKDDPEIREVEAESFKQDDATVGELASRDEADCLEPAAKKLRLSEDGSEAKDPDDSYLEDDSFVDVVKDYY